IAPQYHNLILNRIYATLREIYQRVNRAPQVPYGEDVPSAAEMLAWAEHIANPGEVLSVNTRTGAITLTKADVGLDNVPNYPVASEAEAEAGTAEDKLLTPLRGKQLVDANSPAINLPPGFLYGLKLSNNSSDVANDLDIDPGKCRSGDDD